IDGLRCAGSVPLGAARRRGVTADTRRVVIARSPRTGRAARARLPGTQLRPTRLNPPQQPRATVLTFRHRLRADPASLPAATARSHPVRAQAPTPTAATTMP